MLQRQLQWTSAKIGVGANRVATATKFLERYGYTKSDGTFEKLFSKETKEILSNTDQIGAAILDDGMQVVLNSSYRLVVQFLTDLILWKCGQHSSMISSSFLNVIHFWSPEPSCEKPGGIFLCYQD